MANYNTFAVMDCKTRLPLVITSSARKAREMLQKGVRVEVWNCNRLKEKIYSKDIEMLNEYVNAEKEYIRKKQSAAEIRNARKKGKE